MTTKRYYQRPSNAFARDNVFAINLRRELMPKLQKYSNSLPVWPLAPSLAMLFLGVSQLGCSASSSDVDPEPEAKEIRADKDPLASEAPESELIKLSKQLYQVGMYTVSRDSLATLKDRYPLGAYANFAELKHADSYFFNREYNEAAKAYEAIIKNSPGSADLPYVKLQAARAHVASARDAGRDRQPWERALAIYDELVTGYPGSTYEAVARTERANVVRELTAYDREIIEFYRSQGNQAAVEAREKQFNNRWGSRLGADATPD
jgi:outer membrane assembly lipoprotein YfiO